MLVRLTVSRCLGTCRSILCPCTNLVSIYKTSRTKDIVIIERSSFINKFRHILNIYCLILYCLITLFVWAAYGFTESQVEVVIYICICLWHFRFQKNDMYRLMEALEIPDSYTSDQGSVFSGMECLIILLRRLSYPNRLCDLVSTFGISEPELSMAFKMVTILKLENNFWKSNSEVAYIISWSSIKFYFLL